MRRALGYAALVAALLFAAKRIGDALIIRDLRSAPAATPVRLEEQNPKAADGYTLHRFSFEAVPGERVPVIGSVPAADPGRRYPAIIFLYGIGMKMDFPPEVARALTDAGQAAFVPEQYGRGTRKVPRHPPLQQFMTIRHRLALTIRETRRLVDILGARSDIDPNRIYLWGVSFGALTGCAVVAYDHRIAGGIFTAAGGDFPAMAGRSPYLRRPDVKWWEPAAARLAAEVLRPFDPVRHVGFIAPRPVLFQNASRDEIFPRECVEALFAAAGEPKDLRWFDSEHNRPSRETVESLIRDGLEWLKSVQR